MAKKLVKDLPAPTHVAFIMDGNGRWAKRRGLTRNLGHRAGAERIFDIAKAAIELNIKVISIYAFSSENWSRPQKEIDFLFSYLEDQFSKRIGELMEKGIKVVTMGEIARLPKSTQEVIAKTVSQTKDNNKLILNIALSYGGRPEIVRASKAIATAVNDGELNVEDVNEATFSTYLYTNGLPEVDLLIRTSGEQRLSNFMLWQLAYAEFIFTKTYWPDFTKKELIKCLEQFAERDRRFGGLKND